MSSLVGLTAQPEQLKLLRWAETGHNPTPGGDHDGGDALSNK
jgi:hypothetical protein